MNALIQICTQTWSSSARGSRPPPLKQGLQIWTGMFSLSSFYRVHRSRRTVASVRGWRNSLPLSFRELLVRWWICVPTSLNYVLYFCIHQWSWTVYHPWKPLVRGLGDWPRVDWKFWDSFGARLSAQHGIPVICGFGMRQFCYNPSRCISCIPFSILPTLGDALRIIAQSQRSNDVTYSWRSRCRCDSPAKSPRLVLADQDLRGPDRFRNEKKEQIVAESPARR